MGATAAAVSEFFATDAAVAAGADAAIGTAIATPVITSTAVGTDLGLLGAGTAAGAGLAGAASGGGAVSTPVLGGGAGAAVGTPLPALAPASGAGASTFLDKLGTGAAQAAAGQAIAGILGGGRQSAPQVKPLTPLPDPLAQEEAKKRSIVEQLGRRGRSSTILTDRLGG